MGALKMETSDRIFLYLGFWFLMFRLGEFTVNTLPGIIMVIFLLIIYPAYRSTKWVMTQTKIVQFVQEKV